MSSQRTLLPRSAPAASGISSRSIAATLDRLEARSGETHSLMVVHRGQVVAEGWWAPYSADRPHLLYSLTKSFTSTAVGLAIGDGLLAPDSRVVDVLPDHVPADVSAQGRRITVHHLLTMTAGHPTDSLAEAWQREPDDLVKGFLSLPFATPEGTRHVYDNSTTFLLARMVERVTGQGLPEFLDARLFTPMGIDHAEWDRVASGAAFGFHGLHLTTEAVAAYGELLRNGGRWGDRQLVPRDWVELATGRHIDSEWILDGTPLADFSHGYGYQFWMARHGYHGQGSYAQQCLVIPSHDLVVAVTAQGNAQDVFDAVWECLLPGVGAPATARDDAALADRLARLSLPLVPGSADPGRTVTARLDASPEGSALPDGTTVTVEPTDGGWLVRFEPILEIAVGHDDWRESAPLGRPIVATGAWQGGTYVADLYVITTPHRVRLTVDTTTRTATATWSTPPLTGPDLALHARSPLMTRPDVA
ncbi:serine hydrolase [Streptomyces sp. NBRC 109706]|uniref:serine hydrolase domain-containing protein n=1 Tax=Streptomyces sp. NBRC 109706 TaxID=1550035 RepID=UPI0018FE4B24|nr:serine hydrolase domain-containing protein [Streptomyces sp. NBRC 109706]